MQNATHVTLLILQLLFIGTVFATGKSMDAWIGKAVIFISIIHNIFGLVVFRSAVSGIAADGFVNTVSGAERSIAFWFLFFGFLGMITGLMIDWSERAIGTLPGFLGWSLLAFAVVFVIIMPKSGAWMLFIPAVGAIWRSLDGQLSF